jgi:predicted Rossmann fold nucleotide-binding protein DprA/Smf involved in DNA uptake
MMSQLKKDLKAVAKDLNRLTQKTDKMIKRLEKLEKKAQAAKKPKAKAAKKAVAKKPAKLTASGTVLAIIKRSRKGIDTVALRKKTGFKYNHVRTILYRLSKQGKIKSGGRALYVKA